MNIARTRSLIARHESCRLKPYLDTVGKVTIGWGRNLTDRGITQATADEWLAEDLAACVTDLNDCPWFPRLDDVRQAVLVDLCFNVGFAGLLKFRKLIAALYVGDYGGAAAEIMDSRIALNRRTELATMMRTGQWSNGQTVGTLA